MSKEELIRLLKDSFGENKLDLRAFQYDFPQEEFNNKMEKLNKAEEQIVALIQKPQVTEEWIEEKAEKMKEIVVDLFRRKGTMNYPIERCKDFIRQLYEEMPAKKAYKDRKEIMEDIEK